MKIQLYSDLHIEFEAFKPKTDDADVLVFAGDIEIGLKGVKWLESLNTNKPMIYVLGNHEYYKQTYPKLITKLKEGISKSSIYLLENEAVIIDNVTFHGCTLWTNYELFGDPRIAGYECQQVMTDFKKIRTLPNYSKLRSVDVSIIYQRSLTWLKESLKESGSTHNVVITHHAPSPKSVPDNFKEDIVSSAYASKLDDFIEEYKPDLWLHGHLHNSSDYYIGGCRVVCNPRGYKGEFNSDFQMEKVIEIG